MGLSIVAVLMVLLPALLAATASSDDASRRRFSLGSNENLLLFQRGFLDTEARLDRDTSDEDQLSISAMSSTAKQLRIVQFGGPIKRNWVNLLRASRAEIVGYLPNNAYVIRGSSEELARVAALDARSNWNDERPVRWMGRLLATEKIDPAFSDEILTDAAQANLDVEIELIDSPESAAAIDAISRAASGVEHASRKFLNFVVLSATLPSSRLKEIAAIEEVLFIGPAPIWSLHDERGAQIVAGNLNADGTQPVGPGYMAWLASKGLTAAPDFILDITDTGLDRGSTSPPQLHPDFLDAAGQSRVAYITHYVNDGLTDDRPGHGTLMASVAAGLGATSREDAQGYMYGMGVDPVARIGGSRLFDQHSKLPFVSFTTVASAAYAAGARISNNSWGNSMNVYDAAAQEYDALARDAQPSVAGNQGMVFVFSAGNLGSGHISSPGIAKNVISVAASENYRPEGTDSCNLDGAGAIGPDGADNALDILRFSSGGPTTDGRAKPDIAAPGTHVYGAASQTPGFFGEGLCPGVPVFQPPNQSLYTWSSGTSLAAPHVSGAASLLRRFFVSHNLLGDSGAPSPAMTKAYLLNSASYMTGANAGGSLPGPRQGLGLVSLARAFDGVSRVLIDQTKLFTESGQTFDVQGSLADRSQPLRVTLTWTDPPGMLLGPSLVNDLDLEVSVGGVTLYRGNHFAGGYSVPGGDSDRVNNVESIYLPADAIPEGYQGNFTVTVRASNIAGDGVPGNGIDLDQDFALVIYNITAPIQPPPPPPPKKIPVINIATYARKVLTIIGHDFTAAAQVEINGRTINQAFDFNSNALSLSVRLKLAKLNLAEGDNQIVLVENGERSQPFVLRL
ncbi:MAG TPA: S8 family serine peptidase [Blastocatellia bacterium]